MVQHAQSVAESQSKKNASKLKLVGLFFGWLIYVSVITVLSLLLLFRIDFGLSLGDLADKLELFIGPTSAVYIALIIFGSSISIILNGIPVYFASKLISSNRRSRIIMSFTSTALGLILFVFMALDA